MKLRKASPEEVKSAICIILAPNPGSAAHAAVQHHADEFLSFARSRAIDLSLLRVAEIGGKITHAAMAIVSPGQTMLTFLPQHPESHSMESPGSKLLEEVCLEGLQRGVHLAQALVDPQDTGLRQLYADRAFREMAKLLYLQAVIDRETRPPQMPQGCQWRTYSAETHALFARAILASYDGSLDCPSLNGLRDIEDIIAGHKSSGEFDANLWGVLTETGADGTEMPISVLLLSTMRNAEAVELIYFGLMPAARGRRLEKPAMKVSEFTLLRAFAMVAESGRERFSLAVDARNAPALKLYYRHGFQRTGSRMALLRDLRISGPALSGAPLHG